MNERWLRRVEREYRGMPYPILSNEFQSSDALHGDFDEAGQPREEDGEKGEENARGGGAETGAGGRVSCNLAV